MESNQDFKKIIILLKNIYEKEYRDKSFLDILIYSRIEFVKHWNTTLPEGFRAFNIIIHLSHEVYIRYASLTDSISKVMFHDFNKITPETFAIGKVAIIPDYDKMSIVDYEIKPVYTEWEDLNNGQEKLIKQLTTSSDSFDFQNIGNTSRSLLQKMANLVYDVNVHKPSDNTIDCSPGKFKNQLHAYISSELKGTENRELRLFADASIHAIEKAIDLANTTTHKLEAEREIAEVCVIGTISSISIIKLVRNRKKV